MHLADIIETITEELSTCEAFEPDFEPTITRKNKTVHIEYIAGDNGDEEATSFELEIEGPLCYLNWFAINAEKRGEGRGAQLYNALESALKEIGCQTIFLAPAGDGVGFWPKMGYQYEKRQMLKRI